MFSKLLLILVPLLLAMNAFGQTPPIGPGVSHDLAIWRAAHYSDVRYKLNLTLEKMSPVLKGTIEIRVNVDGENGRKGVGETALPGTQAPSPANAGSSGVTTPIILDWRKVAGHEKDSTISNVQINGRLLTPSNDVTAIDGPLYLLDGEQAKYIEAYEHLIFREGVKLGKNVIKLDFTSPILTSGSAITRYVDKEDGAEYIYSLFVPSDASTAFPVFDQPDLKARFTLQVDTVPQWKVISNSPIENTSEFRTKSTPENKFASTVMNRLVFPETKPISTYVFAFAAGPFVEYHLTMDSDGQSRIGWNFDRRDLPGSIRASVSSPDNLRVFARASQFGKFNSNSNAAETFRLASEGIKYLETYFDYKFPFPKYDLVLIPEFPFGGMEHAGATFLRESSVIFPQEPTKSDYISRANLIFHETAHQWFGDTVTMKWFDDLWLKEGFAEFMAYKTLEKVMPEANAWKVFYERNKQAAYLTDSTKGTTPIYQEIANLSAAKSAYGNIVYRKAPSFLRQAEFYLGEDKFQTAVRAFLKKHEFANAGWEDLVKEFEAVAGDRAAVTNFPLGIEKGREWLTWGETWVRQPGLLVVPVRFDGLDPKRFRKDLPSRNVQVIQFLPKESNEPNGFRRFPVKFKSLIGFVDGSKEVRTEEFYLTYKNREEIQFSIVDFFYDKPRIKYIFPNYQDYGYGIFLLDDKSRDYVLKNIQNEKDPFLRSMMWGSLWDSVREGELDPKEYVELVVKNLSSELRLQPRENITPKGVTLNAETDETIVASILGRVGTALNYYMDTEGGNPRGSKGAQADRSATSRTLPTGRVSASMADLRTRLEDVLIERMQNAPTLGQRITFYRAFLNIAASGDARNVLKSLLTAETQRRGDAKGGNPSGSEGVPNSMNAQAKNTLPTGRVSASIPLRAKDKFDIVTRLIILGDPDAGKLLAELEKTETSDDAKRYAYAARAAFPTKENREKFWNDFVNNKEISESWIEAAMGSFNSIRHDDLSLPYLQRALAELPNLKRNRKIFFVNGWLGAFIGGQRSEEALNIVNKFLADNPNLDNDLRLKILENVDLIERAVKIRAKWGSK